MGKQWKEWQTFIFLGSKITADGEHSHEIKRCLLLERKAMTNLDSIIKSWDITLPTKFRLIKAIFFPVVMYGCDSWTINRAEPWRIDVVLEKTLESPLDCKEIKPVNLKRIGGGLVAKSCPTLANPWTVAWQALLSMGFSRQEFWNGLPLPFPRNLLDPGIEPGSPALQVDSLPTELWGKLLKEVSPEYSLEGLMLSWSSNTLAPDAKNWLTGKDPDVGKDWRQEKGTTEDKMVECYHQLNGHEFEQAPGVGDGQGSLECCSPWGRKESDMTEWLKWTNITDLNIFKTLFQYSWFPL